MTIVLLTTCIFTPLNIAFQWHDHGSTSVILNYTIDVFYFLDILVIFNSAYYKNDVDLIEDRNQIVCNYFKGWFVLDLVSIIPFDLINNKSEFNKLARFARAGRLYKLVKLTKLIRILKVMREQNKILKFVNDLLKISSGIDRLFYFILIFCLLCHIATCLWIVVAFLNQSLEPPISGNIFVGTWLEPFYLSTKGSEL